MLRPTTPTRQIAWFLGLTYVLVLLIAIVGANAGQLTLMASMLVPTVSTAVVIALALPSGRRKEAWGAIGLKRVGLPAFAPAILLPIAIAVVSFGAADLLGVVDLSNLVGSLEFGAASFVVGLVISIIFAMGEEIGWRGYLLPRMSEVTTPRRAATLTGLAHGLYHLPLYLIGTNYMAAGARWIIIPIAMVGFVFGGVFYAWIKGLGRSVWPVAIAHNAFNTAFETLGRAAVASSPVALAYTVGETGLVTVGLIVVFGSWILWRSPVFGTPAAVIPRATTSGGTPAEVPA